MTYDSLDSLVARHRRHGVLLDSNLLVLWGVGNVDAKLIGQHKRLSHYRTEHFNALKLLLAGFSTLIITPHVLTEATNLANMTHRKARTLILATLTQLVRQGSEELYLKERYVRASVLAGLAQFETLAIADAAVIDAARRNVLVLSDDMELLIELQMNALACMSFLQPINQIRIN